MSQEVWEFSITQYLRKSRKLAYQRKKLDEEKKKTVKNKTEKELERNLKIDEIQEVKKNKVNLGESVKTFHQRKVLKLYIKDFTSFTSKEKTLKGRSNPPELFLKKVF